MARKLFVMSLMLSVGVMFATNSFASYKDSNIWKNPKHALKRPTFGPTIQKNDTPTPQVDITYNVLDDQVMNLRALLGGGRKLIRHDCASEDPPSLEVVYFRDVGLPTFTLYSALSTDNGVSWNPVGPLSIEQSTFNDRNHIIGFNGDLTHIEYTEQSYNPGDLTAMFWTDDLFKCLQAFNPMTEIGDPTLDEFYPMIAWVEPSTVYMSFIDFAVGNPYTTYFRSSTDNGTTWTPQVDITGTIGTNGFDMAGMDGPLMIDADGSFIAALAWVGLDATWASANGFSSDFPYPAYTQSTDGGTTWDPLTLIWGTDISQYPQGHTGDPTFDATVNYVGGTGFGLAYTAFNHSQDKCVVTSDGIAHVVYTMRDTTYGYEALFHTMVDNGTITNTHIGFVENPALTGESGVAFMSSLSEADDGHVVVGWTEFIQPDGLGDICMNAIAPGEGGSNQNAVNLTDRPEDITYQRISDRTVSAGGDMWYVDWIFEFYGEGGAAADSTLWHLQATYEMATGVEDPDPKGPGLPRAVALNQNYPNPFNPMTSISYALNHTSNVVLEVMNLRGQLIKTLVKGVREAGNHTVTWDGRNDRGEITSSGIYFYRLRTDEGFNQTRKMVLLK